MKAEEAKKLADQALDQLTSAISQGKSDALTQYLAAMGRFHEYSWGNVMLILTQKPDARKVAGFNTWKKFNRFVKKGEKGIVVIAPMLIKPKEAQETGDAKDNDSILRFKAVYVFDVSQTDGEAMPEFARVAGNPNGHTDRLKKLVAEKGIELTYSAEIGPAQGLSHGGKITLRPDLSPAEEFSTLVHELAHEILHRGERRKETSKTIRETEAEAVAFVVCEAIGLDSNTAAADYIQLYDGDKETLAQSFGFIQQTASEILAAITHE
jgi:antirestriction protein ArdC